DESWSSGSVMGNLKSQWAYQASVPTPYSVQLGYTVHSRPFILNVWKIGGSWQVTQPPGLGRQGFHPSGNLIQLLRYEGFSSDERTKSNRTVFPASSFSVR